MSTPPRGLSELRASDAAALTRTEVAALFGVDARTVTAAIERGDLPSVRIGRRVFVPREPLLAMLTTPTTPTAPAS